MKKIFIIAFFLTQGQQTIAQEKSNSTMQQVILSYLDLKNALVADDGAAAQTAAVSLEAAIAGINEKELLSHQVKPWQQRSEKLKFDAGRIKSTNEIEQQREYFIPLSENLFKFLKTSDSNSMELYYQFCPMANNGKGAYWISEQAVIRNPYYGKKMLTCGSVKENIPSKK